MQIDRHNLATHYKAICDDLCNANFVAFDCEFTGLVTNLEKIQGKFADYQEFYERVKETALNFKILQLGLTAFIYTPTTKTYQAKAYNFYILPFVNTPGWNNIMIAQVDSLKFLSEHGINWNKIFQDGIVPQRLYQPFKYESHRYDRDYDLGENEYFFSKEDNAAIDKIQETLEIISAKKSEEIVDFRKNSIYKRFLDRYVDKLVLRKGKKATKKFQFIVSVMGSLNGKGEDDIVFQKQETKNKVKYVQKTQHKTQTKQNLQKTQDQKSLMQPLAQKMYTITPQFPSVQALLHIISTRRLPIIGHFPNLDLGLIFHTFFAPLPPTFQQFTQQFNQLFPYLYDTKVLSRRVANDFKGMKVSLPSLYAACQQKRYLQNYCNVKQSKEVMMSDSRHEAGYDSYLTGYVFVGMANYLGKQDQGQAVNFEVLNSLNGVVYSRETGEISLREPFTSLTRDYSSRIVLLQRNIDNSPLYKEIAHKLSTYGTLFVTQDHNQVYFVFQQPHPSIQLILKQLSPTYPIKHYTQRKIPKARDIYKNCWQQMYSQKE